MTAPEPVVSLRGVERDYHALRPLRIRELTLHAGESLAVMGLDRAAAEVLVNLITGATLPDAGTVEIFGRRTGDIADADAWMRALDDFGILSERVVLLDEMTVEQNLTLPLSLELDDAGADVRTRVRAMAAEVGLGVDRLGRAANALDEPEKFRLRLGKALIARPRVLLAEHPNAALAPEALPAAAADLSEIISRRGLAALILTADRTFARATARRVLTLQPATGELIESKGWRGWFGG